MFGMARTMPNMRLAGDGVPHLALLAPSRPPHRGLFAEIGDRACDGLCKVSRYRASRSYAAMASLMKLCQV